MDEIVKALYLIGAKPLMRCLGYDKLDHYADPDNQANEVFVLNLLLGTPTSKAAVALRFANIGPWRACEWVKRPPHKDWVELSFSATITYDALIKAIRAHPEFNEKVMQNYFAQHLDKLVKDK